MPGRWVSVPHRRVDAEDSGDCYAGPHQHPGLVAHRRSFPGFQNPACACIHKLPYVTGACKSTRHSSAMVANGAGPARRTTQAGSRERQLSETAPVGCHDEQDSRCGETASCHDDSKLVPLSGSESGQLRRHQPHAGDEDQQEADLRQLDTRGACDGDEHLQDLPCIPSRVSTLVPTSSEHRFQGCWGVSTRDPGPAPPGSLWPGTVHARSTWAATNGEPPCDEWV